jgi:hypothetical protein
LALFYLAAHEPFGKYLRLWFFMILSKYYFIILLIHSLGLCFLYVVFCRLSAAIFSLVIQLSGKY